MDKLDEFLLEGMRFVRARIKEREEVIKGRLLMMLSKHAEHMDLNNNVKDEILREVNRAFQDPVFNGVKHPGMGRGPMVPNGDPKTEDEE